MVLLIEMQSNNLALTIVIYHEEEITDIFTY